MLPRGLSSVIIGSVIVLCLITSGCIFNQPASQEATDAANASAETLFQSFNNGDYGQFSANMNPLLKKGINESSFSGMRSQIQAKYGNYTSKAVTQANVVQGYPNFVYDCTFEKGTLKIRLVMNSPDPSTVDGLWFPGGI